MSKFFLTSGTVLVATLFLVTACAEDGKDAETASSDTPAAASEALETVVETGATSESIMDQSVDFSSPENIEKTMAAIRQQAGEKAAGSVHNAIGYLIVYDLSVKRDKEKLYAKLNGQTPNEIIAMTQPKPKKIKPRPKQTR